MPQFVSCEYSYIFLGDGTKYGAGHQSQSHSFPSVETAQDVCCPWKVEAKTHVTVSLPKGRSTRLTVYGISVVEWGKSIGLAYQMEELISISKWHL